MSGKKVTELPVLATAATDDVIYVVDTSTNTSKQIAVEDIYSGMPQLDSGVFTPVISNIQNSAIIDPSQGLYSRVGDVVTMTFGINIEMDVAESTTTFDFTLPIASNFTLSNQLLGSCNVDSNISILYAKSSSTIGRVEVQTTSAGVLMPDLQLMIQYQIIP
jgi:hypothetical protein